MGPPVPKQIIEHAIQTGVFECEYYHYGPCLIFALDRFFKVAKFSSKFFILIHLIPLLLFKLKELKDNPKVTLYKAFIKFLGSVMYLSSGLGIIYFTICCLKNYGAKVSKYNFAIATGIGCFFGSLFETEGRREELALFVLPRFLESIWKYLKHRRLVGEIKGGENMLFAFAMGSICYYFHKNSKCIKHSYYSLLKQFFGNN